MIFALDIGVPSVAMLLLFSFGMGLRHALEPDHLAAVSNIVSDRKSVWSASIIGALWGIGHTAALLLFGLLVIVFQLQISERVSEFFEFGVAVMLIGLGANTLYKVIRGGKVHWHTHTHGGLTHAHPHVHEEKEAQTHAATSNTHHGLNLSARPIAIGLMHGLAGSGALMLLILTTIPSPVIGMAYILVFGVGSIGGMILMSTLIGLPFHFTLDRFSAAERVLRICAGSFSLLFGLYWAFTNVPS